jgi:hypothetical protein
MTGVTTQPWQGGLSPVELAAAMRDGLEARRVTRVPALPALGPVPTGDPMADLWPLAGLVGQPAPARPGLKGKVVRLARRVMKKLMGPWLDHQTRFNHDLVSTLQAQIAALARQLQVVTDRLNEVTAGVLPAVQALERRVNEFFHELAAVRGGAEPAPVPAGDGGATEEAFLRAMTPGSSGLVLVLSAAGAIPPAGPAAGRVLLLAPPDAAALPLTDGSVHLAVALDRDGSDGRTVWGDDPTTRAVLARVLARGGRVVGSLRAGDGYLSDDDVARRCAPLRVLDVARTGGVTVWAAGV